MEVHSTLSHFSGVWLCCPVMVQVSDWKMGRAMRAVPSVYSKRVLMRQLGREWGNDAKPSQNNQEKVRDQQDSD